MNKEYQKQYRADNKLHISQRMKAYYQRNREALVEKQAIYDDLNRETIKQKNLQRYYDKKAIKKTARLSANGYGTTLL